jgi:uncharacterized damage-inducible protein DinB
MQFGVLSVNGGPRSPLPSAALPERSIPMSAIAALLAELEHEAANTCRVLALLPADQGDYTPHPKSFTLGKLGVHIVEMYTWVEVTLHRPELDFATFSNQPAPFTGGAELVERLDRYLAAARAAFATATDATLAEPWTMRNGEQVFFTMPKGQVLRTFVLNHIVHHRAQLTVYLRMLDIPVPGLYGPSADEG